MTPPAKNFENPKPSPDRGGGTTKGPHGPKKGNLEFPNVRTRTGTTYPTPAHRRGQKRDFPAEIHQIGVTFYGKRELFRENPAGEPGSAAA